MITFNQFKETVFKRIEEKYKGKYKVCLMDIPKPTGETEVGLNISKGDVERGITFRLEDYYEHYGTEISMREAICDICNIVDGNKESMDVSEEIEKDFNVAKDKIVYRLINKQMNHKWLESVPHRDFFDMAIVYYILLSKDENGQTSIEITNQHMKDWGVDEESLYKTAKENTPKLYPYQVEAVRDIILKMSKTEKQDDMEKQKMKEYLEDDEVFPLYELEQRDSINGATALIYPGVLKGIAEMLGSDLILFPACIYDVLISPYREGVEASDYKRMMKHMNESTLPFEEVLSSHVFRYSREEDYLDYIWPDNPS